MHYVNIPMKGMHTPHNKDVEHALKRLDDGTYGTCEACGKPIDGGRLEAMPAARFCLDDQSTAEREIRSSGANP